MDELKPLRWIAGSKSGLSATPLEVRRHLGYALYDAQEGGKHNDAKILRGFGDVGVIEIFVRHDGDTFRASTRCASPAPSSPACFPEEGQAGIATPKQDIELVRARLKLAAVDYERWLGITAEGKP
jgi:hypothetical protein